MDVENDEQLWEGDDILHNGKICDQTSDKPVRSISYSSDQSMGWVHRTLMTMLSTSMVVVKLKSLG